jgi:hypothetical protein
MPINNTYQKQDSHRQDLQVYMYVHVSILLIDIRMHNYTEMECAYNYCRSRKNRHGLNFVNFDGRIDQQNEIHDEILTIMLINAELIKSTKSNPDECFLRSKRTKFEANELCCYSIFPPEKFRHNSKGGQGSLDLGI